MKNIYTTRLHSYFIIALLFVPLLASGQAKLTYLPNKALVQEIVLENELAKYVISLDRSVRLLSVIDKKTGIDYMADSPDLMFLSSRDHTRSIDDVGFHLFTLEDQKNGDKVSVEIKQQSSYVENPFILTQTFTLGNDIELGWKAQIISTATGGRAFRAAQTRISRITFPLIQDLMIGDEEGMHYLYPTRSGFFCIDNPDDFIFYFTRNYDPKMPLDVYNLEEGRGMYFHVLNSQLDLNFNSKEDFKNKVFPLSLQPGQTSEILDCLISPHEGDWHASFQAFKKYIRSNFDFTQYKKPIQEKYRKRLISHFTFLYGFDIYDQATNEFRINQFLDEGEQNFGGYDYMLLWHDYQRMGIDNRDQFDMYEDLPGGLEGLRVMVDNAHARDVQVFIPYKPWDTMNPDKDHFREEARISEAIGADGVFLDTMSESDSTFRVALDAVNPDNVFVSEGRPDLAAAEMVTGSWNQSGNATNKMPNVDLFRFVLPEHNVHNINRGARKRDELIYNALFNGTGFIVWEDIFGEINRYSWNERILIQRYSRIIHENTDAYLTDNPVPLVADLRDDLYVNAFPSAQKCVYPAYQLGRENVNRSIDNRLIGPFMEVSHPDNWHYVDVWNHQSIPVANVNGKNCLVFPEEPTDVMSCVIGMPENLKVEVEGDDLRIQVLNPLEDAVIQINSVNNLTMMEEEETTISGEGGTVNITQLELKFPYKILVKLMQGDTMKDEVIINSGWKKI
jgi:hypothetical protein